MTDYSKNSNSKPPASNRTYEIHFASGDVMTKVGILKVDGIWSIIYSGKGGCDFAVPAESVDYIEAVD